MSEVDIQNCLDELGAIAEVSSLKDHENMRELYYLVIKLVDVRNTIKKREKILNTMEGFLTNDEAKEFFIDVQFKNDYKEQITKFRNLNNTLSLKELDLLKNILKLLYIIQNSEIKDMFKEELQLILTIISN